MTLKGAWGESRPNLENLPFRRTETILQCISSGKVTGSRTNGQLLLLKQKVIEKNLAMQPLTPPPKTEEVASLDREFI